MSDFTAFTDTVRARADGEGPQHDITFDERTSLFGVNGGYIAAAMLRATGSVSRFERPLNVTVQFLNRVLPGPASIETAFVKQNRAFDLAEAKLFQGSTCGAVAQIWSGAQGGLRATQPTQMPHVPHPDELQPRPSGQHPFWDAFEERPINSISPLKRRSAGPEFLRWIRYPGLATPDQAFLGAALTLPIIDIVGYPSATRGFKELLGGGVPITLSLAAQFYELDQIDGWMLGDAYTESICDGIVSTRVRVWSLTGAPIAQGFTQMLVRGAPGT